MVETSQSEFNQKSSSKSAVLKACCLLDKSSDGMLFDRVCIQVTYIIQEGIICKKY